MTRGRRARRVVTADDPRAGRGSIGISTRSIAAMTRDRGDQAALREGLFAFEAHEARVVEQGRDALISALCAIAAALRRWYDDLHEALGELA